MTPLLLALLFLPLVILATLRLSRLITTDWLGEWLIVAPVKRWAAKHEGTVTDFNAPGLWRSKLAKGLDCPFCVGYWIGAGLLLVTACVVLWPVEWIAVSWALLLGSLALNYIVGHVSTRID